MSQSIVATLFDHWGGTQGFVAHCGIVAAFYKQRRDVFEALLVKHLGDMIEYVTPEAGMFLWSVVGPFDDTQTTKLNNGNQVQAQDSRHAYISRRRLLRAHFERRLQ